jgi:hypothetical protein
MPNDTPPPAAAATGFPDAEKHNAEIAAKLLNQDLIKTPPEIEPASQALDHLADEYNKKKEAEGETPPVVPEKKEDAAAPAAVVEPTEAEKEAKAKAEAEAKRAEEIFKDSPSLPDRASPKSSEAFSSIKIKAAQEISARETEIEKLRATVAELSKKVENVVPPETLKEIEDLRTWRAKLDVDADPKFKEFDRSISASHEFIYAQLKKNPAITDAVIEEIKKFGGPENVKMDKIFEAIKDPTMQRLVESKLADIEMQKYSKEQAVKAAKDNIQKYVSEREQVAKASATAHNTVTKQRLDPMIGQLEWFSKKTVDEKADAATKKSIEEHNTFVEQTGQQLAAALQDDSPEMRAILLTGMAQLFNLQREHKTKVAELEATKKSLEEITAKWEKMKGASTTRLRESGAPSTGLPKIKPSTETNIRTGDALDAIAKQVMEERAAAGTRS